MSAEPPRGGALRAAGQSAPATSGRNSRRGLTIAAVCVAAIAVAGLVGVLLVQRGATDAPVDQPGPSPSRSMAVAEVATPTPAVSASSSADTTPQTWPGISSRPSTPFWGAFYCAGSKKTKAIQAAQVGRDAGWRTLVLWTGDYAGLSSSGRDLWVICAGPYSSRSAAQDVVERMDARSRELRAVRPELDIHFGQAYVKLVR